MGLIMHSTVTEDLSVFYGSVATVAQRYTEQTHANLYSLPKFTSLILLFRLL
jgi:hypothetical protein